MFKEKFKYFKSKNTLPSLDQVLDFDNPDKFSSQIVDFTLKSTENLDKYGLKPVNKWKAYELINHPGLIFIKNPFTDLGQKNWTIRCLKDYTKKPNKTNLDSFNLIPKDEEWWEMCCKNKDKLLLNKLRWVTLGYHHDWNTKVYTEKSRNKFPQDLANLSEVIADSVGYNFNAEAAIVNFYHMDSTLSGHIDNSEQNLEAPLLSFSFGQTAIFLMGGENKEDSASAIFLKSGDIVIMSKQSRLCYHGIPKILKTDVRFWDYFTDSDWELFSDYLNNSRININVRQVLKSGQKVLS